MTVGAALALVHHVHACGTCMLRQMHMCSMCMGAALAWLQHVHGGGTCMFRQMHMCSILLLAYTKARQRAKRSCLALYNAHVHVATLACSHQGEAPSLRSVPRLSPAYKALAHACSTPCWLPRQPTGLCCILGPFFCFGKHLLVPYSTQNRTDPVGIDHRGELQKL